MENKVGRVPLPILGTTLIRDPTVYPGSRPLAKRASAGGAVYASVSEYRRTLPQVPGRPGSPQCPKLCRFCSPRVVGQKLCKISTSPDDARKLSQWVPVALLTALCELLA